MGLKGPIAAINSNWLCRYMQYPYAAVGDLISRD